MEILEDNDFFRRLELTRDCSLLLSIDRNTFSECFKDNVSDEINYFGVSGHSKVFHGQIKSKTFEIYRPTKFNRTSLAMTKGTYEDCDSKLKISLVTYIPITIILIVYSMLFLMVIIFNVLTINS